MIGDSGAPTKPYGMAEVAAPPFNTIVVPECLPEQKPRPETWNPTAPNYPWWKVNAATPKPPQVTEEQWCVVYLLAWIKELTRQHAEEWLTVEESRADLEKQLTQLRKISQDRG